MIQLVILTFVDLFVMIFSILLIVRIVMSYVASPTNSFYQGLVTLTEPILEPVRRMLPEIMPGLDLSPLVAYLILQFIQWLLRALIGA